MKLPDSLNNAISYSWVLGWYAGRDGATTDNDKMQATKDIKKKHPDVVKACSCHDELLAACKEGVKRLNFVNRSICHDAKPIFSDIEIRKTGECIIFMNEAIAKAEPN